jgi:hypothetical protein
MYLNNDGGLVRDDTKFWYRADGLSVTILPNSKWSLSIVKYHDEESNTE